MTKTKNRPKLSTGTGFFIYMCFRLDLGYFAKQYIFYIDTAGV